MPQFVACAIFLVTLALTLTDRVHRVTAAACGAALMMLAGYALGFYREEQAIAAIDFRTLGLLLGMMIIVRLLERTGFFEYVAIVTAQRSGARPWLLLVLLGAATSILSMFLDNVTTVVLIAPVTVLIAEILGLAAAPFLMAEALLANIGGIATLVGDPPNVLVGSAASLSFTDFLTHLGPITLAIWLVALVGLRWLFRVELAQPATDPGVLQRLKAHEAIHDRVALRRLLLILAATIGLFLVQGRLAISPALVALSGAAAALVWLRPDVALVLREVEWGVLLFFGGLFVMVGGLQAAGVLETAARSVMKLGNPNPLLQGLAMMWGVALVSGVVDNVPVAITMIPVTKQVIAAGSGGPALWWALALGAGLGGNSTVIGSTANVVVAGISERTRTPVSARAWLRRGLPVALITTVAASFLYAALFRWLNAP